MLNKKIIIITLFFVTSFLIYSSSINSSFHFDDFRNFANNPDTMINNLSLGSLKKAALNEAVTGGFRPIAYLSFALNYYFNGSDPASYHVVNIILHALSAFIIYLIILLLFDYDSADDEKKEKLILSAFFSALLWLAAPFNSQPVIYLVQRMTLMMTLFFLLSFYYYVKGRKEKKTKYLILSSVFFLLSFLSKQNALVFPLVIVLYELIFVKKGDLKRISKNEKIILAVFIIIMLLPIIFFFDKIREGFIVSGRTWGFSYYERELTQFRVLVFYLSLIILPIPGRLSITHDIAKSTSLFTPVTTFFSMIFILGLFVFSVLRIRKSQYFSFAFLWFFITMSVEAIMPIELMYEHRMYLPSIFLVGAFVDYVTDKFQGKKNVVIVLFSVLSIAYGTLTGIRGAAWQNEFTLWSDVYSKYSNSSLALINIGSYQLLQGDYSNAEKNLLNALKLKEYKDSNKYIYNNLGYIYLQKQDYQRSIEMYKKLLKYGVEYNTDYADSFLHLGNAYIALGDYNNALISFNKSLEIGLKNENIYGNLGRVYNNIGATHKILRNYKEAASNLKKALIYLPNNTTIQRNLKEIEMLLNK